MSENEWYLVSSHGAVLMYIAVTPDCTIRDIADAMSLTRRTIWGTVGELRKAGLLDIRREGRAHHYTVNLDGKFKHPTILQNTSLREVFGELVRRHSQSEQPQRR